MLFVIEILFLAKTPPQNHLPTASTTATKRAHGVLSQDTSKKYPAWYYIDAEVVEATATMMEGRLSAPLTHFLINFWSLALTVQYMHLFSLDS